MTVQEIIPPQPQLTPIEIEGGEQPWATIYLADGHKLRVQLTVASVHRSDKKGPDGLPEYIIQAGFHTQAFAR